MSPKTNQANDTTTTTEGIGQQSQTHAPSRQELRHAPLGKEEAETKWNPDMEDVGCLAILASGVLSLLVPEKVLCLGIIAATAMMALHGRLVIPALCEALRQFGAGLSMLLAEPTEEHRDRLIGLREAIREGKRPMHAAWNMIFLAEIAGIFAVALHERDMGDILTTAPFPNLLVLCGFLAAVAVAYVALGMLLHEAMRGDEAKQADDGRRLQTDGTEA